MKCLVIVKDGQLVLRSTPGVETACIVDGEDVDLPDDWADLPVRVVHIVPVRLEKDVFEQNDPQNWAPQCPETQLAAPNTQVQHSTARLSEEEIEELNEKEEKTRRRVSANLMFHPYCFDCGDNHAPGMCPGDFEIRK